VNVAQIHSQHSAIPKIFDAQTKKQETKKQKTKWVHNCKPSLFNGIKTVSILQQQLHGKIVHRNSVIYKHDRERGKPTDKQTNKKNSTFLAAPAADEIRTPANLAWR